MKVWICTIQQEGTLDMAHFKYLKLVKTSKILSLPSKSQDYVGETLLLGEFWLMCYTLEKVWIPQETVKIWGFSTLTY
jgi:hypothetical protein